MKELVRMILMLVILGVVVWLGKNYYDNQIDGSKIVNREEVETGSIKIETLSSVEGYELKIKNKEGLFALLPELKDGYKIILPEDQSMQNVKTISVELVNEPQEWYRVAMDEVQDYLSSVGVSWENGTLSLKIYLSEEHILKQSQEDRDWIMNNVALTALYALTNDWETEELTEQYEIVRRLGNNVSVKLPFEILK